MMVFKPIRKKFVAWFAPFLAYWTIRVLGRTMRFEEINTEVLKPFLESRTAVIAAFWHGRLLMMPWAYKNKKGRKLRFLVSSHRDGQVVGRALERFGFSSILGSTKRGGAAALKEMAAAIRDGFDVAIVPDGPKGPRYRAEFGVIELAKRTGRPVIPITFNASKRKIFRTWDRFLLPYPFSKGVFIWGEPIYVNPNGDRAHIEEKRLFLEKRLNELTEEADRYFSEYRNPKHEIRKLKNPGWQALF
jgi:lysophospholipid acyltransferase (LPLAT)-like uncharacterized protein